MTIRQKFLPKCSVFSIVIFGLAQLAPLSSPASAAGLIGEVYNLAQVRSRVGTH